MQYSCRARRQLALLLLFVLTTVVAGEDGLVSNGTCYYAEGKEANSVYIPCGNDAFGVYSCCMNGDACLSSNACYNSEYGDTYIAGCTDSTYSDPACGNKGEYRDLQWASLVRCFVSNDTNANDEEWATCYESNQPIVGEHDGGCVCTASAQTAAFTDNPVLTDIAVLPAATGQSISYQPGHTPPSDLTPTAQAASSKASQASASTTDSTREDSSTTSATGSSHGPVATSSTTTSSSLPASATNNPNATGLSTAAEAGIGIAVGLGVLLVCAGLFLMYRRRVKRQFALNHPSNQPFISPSADKSKEWSPPAQAGYYHDEINSASADMRSPAWSGHKAELPTDEHSAFMASRQPSAFAQSSSASEVEGAMVSTISRNSYGRQSPTFVLNGSEVSRDGTNRGSWMQPSVKSGGHIVHELPGSYVGPTSREGDYPHR